MGVKSLGRGIKIIIVAVIVFRGLTVQIPTSKNT